jgi:hypothetical protein
MRLVEARGLPASALDAAAAFHASCLPRIREAIAEGELPLCIVFDLADHTHTAWRLATTQSLAREAAPERVNALASDDETAIDAALSYLNRAPGVTGQYLVLDGNDAGNAAQ